MENRILIIGDELLGEQGEVATRCVEMILCREPNRPIQFSVNAPALPSIGQFIARASSDIIGKQAGRIVFCLGLKELFRERGDASKVAASYSALADEILSKTKSFVHFATIPQDLVPDNREQIAQLNESIRKFAGKDPNRVSIIDFAQHVEFFKEKQVERGKYARQLFSEDGKPMSICLTLLTLHLQDCILEAIK